MQSPFSRRTFLAGAAAASLSRIAFSSEPIARHSGPQFAFSVAAYSYRNLLRDKDSGVTLETFIDDCAKMGADGAELTSYFFPEKITNDYLRKLKRQCFQLGLDISGTAVGNDFGHPAGDERQKQIDHVKRWVDYAETMGAPVIRIFAGHLKQGTTAEQSHQLMVEGMQEACEYAGAHGVHLALENHGGPTATPEGLLALVKDVDSPWFGVNLDTGNFHTKDIYGDLAKVAPYALNVQVKVVVSGPDKKKEPTDFKRLAKIMRDANYRGYIVLEYEENGNPRQECPKFLDELRNTFA